MAYKRAEDAHSNIEIKQYNVELRFPLIQYSKCIFFSVHCATLVCRFIIRHRRYCENHKSVNRKENCRSERILLTLTNFQTVQTVIKIDQIRFNNFSFIYVMFIYAGKIQFNI